MDYWWTRAGWAVCGTRFHHISPKSWCVVCWCDCLIVLFLRLDTNVLFSSSFFYFFFCFLQNEMNNFGSTHSTNKSWVLPEKLHIIYKERAYLGTLTYLKMMTQKSLVRQVNFREFIRLTFWKEQKIEHQVKLLSFQVFPLYFLLSSPKILNIGVARNIPSTNRCRRRAINWLCVRLGPMVQRVRRGLQTLRSAIGEHGRKVSIVSFSQNLLTHPTVWFRPKSVCTTSGETMPRTSTLFAKLWSRIRKPIHRAKLSLPQLSQTKPQTLFLRQQRRPNPNQTQQPKTPLVCFLRKDAMYFKFQTNFWQSRLLVPFSKLMRRVYDDSFFCFSSAHLILRFREAKQRVNERAPTSLSRGKVWVEAVQKRRDCWLAKGNQWSHWCHPFFVKFFYV